VNVFQVSPEGRIHVLDTFRPGDLFALVPALDGGPYPASAEAREDAVLVLFPREELIEAMKAAPRTALAVAALCAGRSRRLSRKVASVALRGVRERVAAWLVEQAEARSPCAACGAPVVVPLEARHEEIARRLGTAREVFARMLRTLEEEGKITRSRGAIRIRDLPGLRAIAGMEARE
jgi:CRP/FNR family transcriptional regulator